MGAPFVDPAGQTVLDELGAVFRKKPLFRATTNPVVFVCGGRLDQPKTMRAQFCAWAKSNLSGHIVLLAEVAYEKVTSGGTPDLINMAVFEDLIAGVSDCLLIFPESVGSYVEVGFFSKNSVARRKTLIVNDLAHQASDSFINTGPIQSVNEKSVFRPALHLPINEELIDFSAVKERLQRLTARKNRRRINDDPRRSKKADEKFFILLEAITIVRIVPVDSMYLLASGILGNCRKKEILHLLSIIEASDYVRREGPYILANYTMPRLVEFDDFAPDEYTLRVLQYYRRHAEYLYRRVAGRSDAH